MIFYLLLKDSPLIFVLLLFRWIIRGSAGAKTSTASRYTQIWCLLLPLQCFSAFFLWFFTLLSNCSMITPMKESQVSLLCSIKETIFCVLSMATLFQVRLFYDVEQSGLFFNLSHLVPKQRVTPQWTYMKLVINKLLFFSFSTKRLFLFYGIKWH